MQRDVVRDSKVFDTITVKVDKIDVLSEITELNVNMVVRNFRSILRVVVRTIHNELKVVQLNVVCLLLNGNVENVPIDDDSSFLIHSKKSKNKLKI